MPDFPLPTAGSAHTLAGAVSITGLELLPAVVAALILTVLGAALVITALRRRDAERRAVAPETESVLPRPVRVDA